MWTASTPPTRASCPRRGACTTVSFEEMLEMASHGLQGAADPLGGVRRQVQGAACACCPASRPGTSTSTKKPRSGTLITFEEDENMEQAVVSGIAFNRDEAKITVLGVPDKPGIAYQILGAVADANIDVDVIIQNVSAGRHDRLQLHRQPQRLRKRAMELLERRCMPSSGAHEMHGRHQDLQGLASSASACAATSASPARCSAR